MNLKDFLASRDKPPELYWSLVLEPGWVQAGIWFIGTDKAEVISISPGAAWETENELIGACDAALSSSIQKLPEDTKEPNKTVFGVPAAWVKGGEIQEEYLGKIKNICSELSLAPVGFVVIPEAIAHLYKSEEGTPLSGVIIGLGKEFLEITVFKLGNLVGTTSVSRSVSLIEDVTEGLARFEGAAPLPSRIVLFDGKEGQLEEARDTLMGASWEDAKVKFLHTPKVEFLMTDKKVIATALAGAAEIGHVTGVSAKEEESEEVENIPEEVENVTSPEEELSAADLGFAVGEDLSANIKPQEAKDVEIEKPKQSFEVKEPERRQMRSFRQAGTSLLSKAKNMFGSVSVPKPKKLPIVWPIVLAALLLIAGVGWWFLPTAEVTIFVSPKNFSEDQNISFSTNGQSDPANSIIPGSAITSNVSGEKTKGTTGTRLIGDKATGSVQVSNGNPNGINLAAGTFLSSSGGLKFVTTQEASVSGQILPGQPGTVTVTVTANDIGSQYNLAKGEIFSVGNFSKSLVAATSQADFSGGSSQQISAVSKDDQTSLETDLKNELLGQAVNDLSGKVNSTQVFVNDPANSQISAETFDHKVGDQADNLKLSLSLDVTAIAADREKLLEYARNLLRDKIPQGFVLRDSQISFKFTFVSQKDGMYTYKATISANFLPQIDPDTVIDKILGKTPDVAVTYLHSIPGFVNAEVKLKPNLPGFLETMPHVHKNITIDVMASQ